MRKVDFCLCENKVHINLVFLFIVKHFKFNNNTIVFVEYDTKK